MKALFLDHFGVMCLAKTHGTERGKDDLPRVSEMRIHGGFDSFDPDAVKVLNSILDFTGAEIVVSSDWKKWSMIEDMGDFYIEQGVSKRPFDFTPTVEVDEWLGLRYERALEIRQWLQEHIVESWVAVDDLYLGEDMEWGLTNFVWISRTDEGIKQVGAVEKIIKFLT